jgi:hypothetical protein
MDKNLELVAGELFAKLRSQFSKVELRDENRAPTDDEKLARNFTFDYEHNDVALGSISIDISDEDGLVVIYSKDIVENQSPAVKKNFFNFLRELREFSKPKFMQFSVRDITKTNLDKRDYNFLSRKHGEAQMTESKLWGGAKTSYQDLGEAKLIIKHNQPINSDLPAGRTMHIECIYIENQAGERFRYPIKHLNGARAMAEHIKHGGNPYDEVGQYIVSLSEELNSLRKFKGYVSRTPMVSESMGDILEKVGSRLEEIKKEISSLQKSSYYESFSQSYIKSENKEIPEDIVNDWVERLTIKTFNEELKNVFPYIYKLVGQDVNPVKEVNFEDFTNEDNTNTFDNTSTIKQLSFEEHYEKYINKIIGEGADIFSNNEQEQSAAIEKLNQLIKEEFPVGPDGSNASESLQDIINDKELDEVFAELADINPQADIRNILKDYIAIKDEENGTDILSKIQFSETDSAEPAPEPAAAEPAVAPEPAAPAPPAAAPAAPVPPSMPMSPGVAMSENIKRVIKKAKSAGMKAEDTFTLFGEEITLADAITRAGLDLHEFFDSNYENSGDEVVEFVRSMFDEDGNTPKGPTGVLLSVEKKFGEKAVNKAQHVMNELMSQAEMKRIQELAGLPKESAEDEFDKARRSKRDAEDEMWAAGKGSGKDAEETFDKSRRDKKDSIDTMKAIGKGKNESILDELRIMAGLK